MHIVAIACEPNYLHLTSFCSAPDFLFSPSRGPVVLVLERTRRVWEASPAEGTLRRLCHFILKPDSRSVISTFLDEGSLTRDHIVSRDSALELGSF